MISIFFKKTTVEIKRRLQNIGFYDFIAVLNNALPRLQVNSHENHQ